MPKEINCTPAGLLVEGGSERIHVAYKHFINTTSDLANYFTQLQDEQAISETLDFEEGEEVKRLIKVRGLAQEELLRAIANHPSSDEVRA